MRTLRIYSQQFLYITYSSVELVAQWYRIHLPMQETGDVGLISGLGRSSGEGNGNPLQYSCLENSMDRGVWRATVHGATKNRTGLSNWALTPSGVPHAYFICGDEPWHAVRLTHEEVLRRQDSHLLVCTTLWWFSNKPAKRIWLLFPFYQVEAQRGWVPT